MPEDVGQPWHLPGLSPVTFTDLVYERAAGPVRMRLPVATPQLVAEAARRVVLARDAYLAALPVARVVEAIDAAVRLLLDPCHPIRRQAEALLPAVTGYSPPMVRRGVTDLLRPFQRRGLMALLRSELRTPSVLNGPSAPGRGGGYLLGPRLTSIVLAGNIPAVAIEGIVHALLVKSACLVKSSSRDPLLPALFAQALAEADGRLAEAVAVLWWKGGTGDLDRAALAPADAVVAYGGREAIEALRRQAPASGPFIGYGPRISFAAVSREALGHDALPRLARRAAWDVSLFDQQGCVAPHAIYVERGGEASPLHFARALAEAMESFQRKYPRGELTPTEASTIHQRRGAWEMRQAAGRPVRLWQSRGSTAWTVAYDEEAFDLTPSCLNRVVSVIPLDMLEDLPRAVSKLRPYLQTAGMAMPADRLKAMARRLADVGVTRVCPVGRMQYPPPRWRHDGMLNLLGLLRWVDVEGEGLRRAK